MGRGEKNDERTGGIHPFNVTVSNSSFGLELGICGKTASLDWVRRQFAGTQTP